MTPSPRASIITRRTYNRPLDEKAGIFETWEQTIDRVIGHQSWLWKRAKGWLSPDAAFMVDDSWRQDDELSELRQLMLERKVLVAGRTLWLGGTEVAKRREASQFNCAFTHAETVYDMVDILWLLLQGCGVGFRPVVGTLNGFSRRMQVEIIRSTRTEKGGRQTNLETFENGVWTISVGDAAEAWAKALGKLLAGKYPARKLVLDFSEIRPAGERLKGYGWICSGDEDFSKALFAIAKILNRKAGTLLSRMDILDVINHMGTVLSSRRSAEIALIPYGEDEWYTFATAKKDFWVPDENGDTREHRQQSNNSLLFRTRPSKGDLEGLFAMIVANGGSEPGFINQAAATVRAPWFKGVNPCAEILLGNKSFCNLTEVDLGKFKGDHAGLTRAVELAARANYRQTCVNLKDGILQEAWHLNNEFLRLCGVGLTGIVRRPDLTSYDFEHLQRTATAAAYGMADELGTPRPKNVTTVKPSGTLSKIMDTTSGMHKPLGKFIFENVTYSKHDPVVAKLAEAGYKVRPKPSEAASVLVTFPVSYPDVPFEDFNGTPVNLEPAVAQLERYRMLMQHWCQQNVSATIYYDTAEVPAIVEWLHANWDSYVGVSFLPRTDPTKTAKDLGYLYLPQEVVTKEVFDEYVASLSAVALDDTGEGVEESVECPGGVCPVR
jgi:adenosylcobalamin-dependent ribonucleoside-triphosphate reductase